MKQQIIRVRSFCSPEGPDSAGRSSFECTDVKEDVDILNRNILGGTRPMLCGAPLSFLRCFIFGAAFLTFVFLYRLVHYRPQQQAKRLGLGTTGMKRIKEN